MAKARTKKKDESTLEGFLTLKDIGIAAPQLVLGIPVTNDLDGVLKQEYSFKPGRTWHNIVHETRGIHKKQRYIMGTILHAESALIENGIRKLNDRWYNCTTEGEISLGLINAYNADLKRYLNAACDNSWKNFEEGFYPIDLEFLNTVSNIEHSYRNLDEFVDWKSGWQRAAGIENRWGLFILGTNRA